MVEVGVTHPGYLPRLGIGARCDFSIERSGIYFNNERGSGELLGEMHIDDEVVVFELYKDFLGLTRESREGMLKWGYVNGIQLCMMNDLGTSPKIELKLPEEMDDEDKKGIETLWTNAAKVVKFPQN